MSANYLPIVDQKFPDSHAAHLRTQMDAVASLYSMVCCNGNADKAAAILRKQQQEQVSFERNSIWKDMVGQERRAATLHVQVRCYLVGALPAGPCILSELCRCCSVKMMHNCVGVFTTARCRAVHCFSRVSETQLPGSLTDRLLGQSRHLQLTMLKQDF
jgi:hypothetical protein